MALEVLSQKADSRTHAAYRPKTRQAYKRMFEVFLAFCIHMGVPIQSVNVKILLSFLECLVSNNIAYSMLCNYVSAIKASFVLYDLRKIQLKMQKAGSQVVNTISPCAKNGVVIFPLQ